MLVCWPCLSRERGMVQAGHRCDTIGLSDNGARAYLQSVEDSVMIGYKFQRASSGGVWGWEGGSWSDCGDIPRSVGVSPSERDGLGSWDSGGDG